VDEAKVVEMLRLLEEDARLTPEQLAKMLDADPSEVRRKMKELEREGVIVKYKTVVNWERLGRPQVFAFIEVRVTPERDVGFDAIARRIYRFPEVHSMYLVSGEYDLAVVVQGRDMREIADFVASKLACLPQVQGTNTHFVLKRYKVDGDILEERPEDRRQPIVP